MLYIIAAILSALIIGGDQLAKLLVVKHVMPVTEVKDIIPGVINFVYVPNGGSAFGFFPDNIWLLIGLTVVIMLICMTLLIKKGISDKIFFFGIVCIMSGGIGNLLDRIFRGKVVDFIQFDFFQSFPVFNVADMAICIGAGLLFLYFIIDFAKDRKAAKRKIVEVQAVPQETETAPQTETNEQNP